MSADLIAYGDCDWTPEITVVNPDGTRETRRIQFGVKEGAKIYIDTAVYADDDSGVGEPNGALDNYISPERLAELWERDQE